MKALVTGATGFIGSHLADALYSAGFEVSCLVRDPSNLRNLDGIKVKVIKGDCAQKESLLSAVENVDYIFHLAGLTKASCEADYYDANVKGTENMVSAALKNAPNIKRFIYLSSLAAAGPSCDGSPLKEDCETKPVSIYGKTKLEGERIVFSHRNNLPVTIIRPPAVYGPRDGDMLVFFKMVNAGVIPYWGRRYYSFLYIDDLINGIISALTNEAAVGGIFFMSDGSIYTSDEIIGAVSAAVGKTPVRLLVPGFIMPILGFIAERIRGVNIINPDKIRELRHAYWVCDTTKAREILNFNPATKIREGTKWTADWYRIHRWL
ncbi:MAG: NAD(P)-dependent oxidoreductase [Nitrospirae bacterium]|nr:NAD(P)-dependent oxidoreductase [Nitrospirota bacterium]